MDGQGLGNFKQVLLRDSQCIGAHTQRHMEANRIQHFPGDGLRWLCRKQRGRKGNLQVFENGQIVEHGGVLKGNGNP